MIPLLVGVRVPPAGMRDRRRLSPQLVEVGGSPAVGVRGSPASQGASTRVSPRLAVVSWLVSGLVSVLVSGLVSWPLVPLASRGVSTSACPLDWCGYVIRVMVVSPSTMVILRVVVVGAH
jgi:hypothetical protein